VVVVVGSGHEEVEDHLVVNRINIHYYYYYKLNSTYHTSWVEVETFVHYGAYLQNENVVVVVAGMDDVWT
jgi:hypothetical protein